MTNNDLYCEKCKSQHHPSSCPLDNKEQKIEQTIREGKLRAKVYYVLNTFAFQLSPKSFEKRCTQIISLVRADERKRILDEIESKEYLTPKDMQFIYKLLRPESDTEGK